VTIFFAFIGGWFCAGLGVLLTLGILIRHGRRQAMQRHPAGRISTDGHRPDGLPWFGHVGCCGQKVYGDTLEDLAENERFHRNGCPAATNRRNAA